MDAPYINELDIQMDPQRDLSGLQDMAPQPQGSTIRRPGEQVGQPGQFKQQPQTQIQKHPSQAGVHQKKDFFKGLLTDFLFSLGRGLEAGSKAPVGMQGQAAMGAAMQAPEELSQMREQQRYRQMQLQDDMMRARVAEQRMMLEQQRAPQEAAYRQSQIDRNEAMNEQGEARTDMIMAQLAKLQAGEKEVVIDYPELGIDKQTITMKDVPGLLKTIAAQKGAAARTNTVETNKDKIAKLFITQRELDRTSREGIARQSQSTRIRVAELSRLSFKPLEQLDPNQQALIQSVGESLRSNRMEPHQAMAMLGGIKGGLVSHLAKFMEDRIPTKLKENVQAMKSARDIFIPQIEKLLEEALAAKAAGDGKKFGELELILDRYAKNIGTNLARGIGGERGVITNQDRDAAIGLVPGWKSALYSADYARKQLAIMKEAAERQIFAWEVGYFDPTAKFDNKAPAGTKRPPLSSFEK